MHTHTHTLHAHMLLCGRGGFGKHISERGAMKTLRLLSLSMLDLVLHALGLPAAYVKV